jgi:hypothetical protein
VSHSQFLSQVLKMVYRIQATVSGCLRQLLLKMFAFCESGTVDEDFYMVDDSEIHWGAFDDQFDRVTKYVNFLTPIKTEYRRLLKLIHELYKCCGSSCTLQSEEIDNDSSSFEFDCDVDYIDIFYLSHEIYVLLNCFDEVQSISFSDL